MPSIDTSDSKPIPPTHEDFRWITGPGKDVRFADFIELTRDVSAGIRSSLQISYASDLAREINLDNDPEDSAHPAIGKTDAANLLRLSIAAATLLQHISQEHIDQLNKFWDE
ncbi:hypothetical protein FHW67_001458 [Herbaspirillum sp. Sphag1AN]|uniref:hypothetical protein n=1 Tax=unclassified Herbaspirillum TaxID=2624150 RepID=UPI00160BA1DE|nr:MULTISPECIES: hypothetical protein [unclassified Herbaspirillum]MBB3212190.1 hypothetical protein [Herbaspirillum sp. Sphag1AN]MBB3243976.1 hypothetical protein [Herbaspirillum sp. Sphag64]